MTDIVIILFASFVLALGIGVLAGALKRANYFVKVMFGMVVTVATFLASVLLSLLLRNLDGTSLGALLLWSELLLSCWPRARYFLIPVIFGVISGFAFVALNWDEASIRLFLAGSVLGAFPTGAITAIVAAIDIAYRKGQEHAA
jgi:hypothetical protein